MTPVPFHLRNEPEDVPSARVAAPRCPYRPIEWIAWPATAALLVQLAAIS